MWLDTVRLDRHSVLPISPTFQSILGSVVFPGPVMLTG